MSTCNNPAHFRYKVVGSDAILYACEDCSKQVITNATIEGLDYRRDLNMIVLISNRGLVCSGKT